MKSTKITVLNNLETAIHIGDFLTSKHAFDQTWAPNEKEMVIKAVKESLSTDKHSYWYIEDNNTIIGAIGVRENKYGSDGYEMDSDYVAIHKDYRRRGFGTLLLDTVEAYVRDMNGRYLHILSCDIESYIPSIKFYQSNGYKIVGELPNYYVNGEGRIDLFKEFNY